MERYDLVIVGGGAAGINALKAAITFLPVFPRRLVTVGAGVIGLERAWQQTCRLRSSSCAMH